MIFRAYHRTAASCAPGRTNPRTAPDCISTPILEPPLIRPYPRTAPDSSPGPTLEPPLIVPRPNPRTAPNCAPEPTLEPPLIATGSYRTAPDGGDNSDIKCVNVDRHENIDTKY